MLLCIRCIIIHKSKFVLEKSNLCKLLFTLPVRIMGHEFINSLSLAVCSLLGSFVPHEPPYRHKLTTSVQADLKLTNERVNPGRAKVTLRWKKFPLTGH